MLICHVIIKNELTRKQPVVLEERYSNFNDSYTDPHVIHVIIQNSTISGALMFAYMTICFARIHVYPSFLFFLKIETKYSHKMDPADLLNHCSSTSG